MDRYSVVITGAGPHHSAQAADVDALLAAFVAQLRALGHADVRCRLTTNAREELLEPASAPKEEPAPAAASPKSARSSDKG